MLRAIDIRYKAMAASLGIAVLMLAGKTTAFALTGSEAILSDAVESVIHILATAVAAFSLWFSHQEACERHPYGHGKIAYFSAGVEGGLILLAPLFIFYEAGRALVEGPEVAEPHLGLAITAALGLVNLALGLSLIAVGKRHNALILVANGHHVLTDMWSSLGVIVGIAIVWVTGLAWLDPVVAILVGVNIAWGGWRLIVRSFKGLIEHADPAQSQRLLNRLKECVHEGYVSGFHQLRHREVNGVLWVEVHLLVAGDTTVAESHRQVTKVEDALKNEFPDFKVYVTTHVEPRRHERAHPEGHEDPGDPFAHRSAPQAPDEGSV